MRYGLIAVCAATMLTTSALAAPWNGVRDSGPGGYESSIYQAYAYAGRVNTTYHRRGYAPAYVGPGYRVVFHERCTFTNDPSC